MAEAVTSANFVTTIDKVVGSLIAQHFIDQRASLKSALEYATLRGGKRFRAHLVHAVAQAFSPNFPLTQDTFGTLSLLAASIEIIHAYSLVHDDLPAMDNAETRRGIPTVHRHYGEAHAILVGDMLQALSFNALSQIPEPDVALHALSFLSQGAIKIVRGQAREIEEQKHSDLISEQTVTQIIADKTAALLETACVFGVIAVQEPQTLPPWGSKNKTDGDVGESDGDVGVGKNENKDSLSSFPSSSSGSSASTIAGYPIALGKELGYHLGMMYQIIDDINDHDEHSRTNITRIEGIPMARERVAFHHKQCTHLVSQLLGNTQPLIELITLVANNTHASMEPVQHCDSNI